MSLPEEWRPAPGHEGYEVSHLGRVRKSDRIIEGYINAGYRRVSLGTGKTAYVHQLVLEAFVAPRPNGRDYAHHLNGDLLDNRAENLAWLSTVDRPDTLAERLHAKIAKQPGSEGSCWHWTGSKNRLGYGQIWDGGRLIFAHRASWQIAHGPIPAGMQVDHRCHNPACVNPDHLRTVTQSQNMQHRSGAQRNSRSGHRGVSWDSARGGWTVRAKAGGKYHYGGRFDDLDEAIAAAKALRDRLMTHHDPACD